MDENSRHFVFTMTAGRTGTAYLVELLRRNLTSAEVHHERHGFDDFGVESPDLSHRVLFNSRGNVAKVQEFWEAKLERIKQRDVRHYVETSHVLMKAGLVENISPLFGTGIVHFVALTRDLVDTIVSYRLRADFANRGNLWLWYLDPEYPRAIIDAKAFARLTWEKGCLWYLCEIRARVEYYRLLLADEPRARIHDVDIEQLNHAEEVVGLLGRLGQETARSELELPAPVNQNPPPPSGVEKYRATVRALVDSVTFDARALAREFFERGSRL